MKKNIKIIFIEGVQNKNSAFYNRFLMIQKMARMNFNCETIECYTFPKQVNTLKKIYYGLLNRYNHIKIMYKLPSSSKNDIDILFLFSKDPIICLYAWLLVKKIKGYKLVSESNEFPYSMILGNKVKIFFYKVFILWWKYRILDGLFSMTNRLINFYTPYVSKNCSVFKLPMTVDFSRFTDLESKKRNSDQYIFYAGSLLEKKDGVESLVKAFYRVNIQFPDLKLFIAGNGDKTNLEKLIKDLNLSTTVSLLGLLSKDKIPYLLSAAQILVLPRPNSLQAEGGFPTKLGEYLASGTPVIASRVGEIDAYLNDDEISFISPDNIENDLVENIIETINNKKEALEKAKRGQKKALNMFSIESNSHIIKSMVNSLK